MNTIRVSDATIAALIEDAIGRTADASPPIRCLGPTYVAFRRSGRRLAHMWREEQELAAALHAAVAEARGILDVEAIDAVELCLSREFRVVPSGGTGRLPGNAQRGILGLELSCNGSTERAAPTEMIAANRSFEKAMARLLAACHVAAGQRPPAHAVLRTFAARQVLVRLGPPATAVTLLRGNRPVPLESMSAGMLSEMAEGMGAWLLRNQQPDGRLTYKYWPSRGTNSPADNPIRQLMATRCLIRFAVVFGRSATTIRTSTRARRSCCGRTSTDVGPIRTSCGAGGSAPPTIAAGTAPTAIRPSSPGIRRPTRSSMTVCRNRSYAGSSSK